MASGGAVMLLVNLQLATTSTGVDGFQPAIELAKIHRTKQIFTYVLRYKR